jgi:hypothetical protein
MAKSEPELWQSNRPIKSKPHMQKCQQEKIGEAIYFICQ